MHAAAGQPGMVHRQSHVACKVHAAIAQHQNVPRLTVLELE